MEIFICKYIYIYLHINILYIKYYVIILFIIKVKKLIFFICIQYKLIPLIVIFMYKSTDPFYINILEVKRV